MVMMMIVAFNFIAQLSTPVKLALCSLSEQHRPSACTPAAYTRLALIGAVASAGGSGDVVNLSFWLNRDALCGVVDNILLWLQPESVGSSAPFKFQILQSARQTHAPCTCMDCNYLHTSWCCRA